MLSVVCLFKALSCSGDVVSRVVSQVQFIGWRTTSMLLMPSSMLCLVDRSLAGSEAPRLPALLACLHVSVGLLIVVRAGDARSLIARCLHACM